MDHLQSIFFPVEKVPSEDICPGYEFNSGSKYAVVVDKPDGGKLVVNHCSEVYHLVKNQEIIPAFLQALQRFYKVEVAVRQYGYSQFHVDFALKNQGMEIMPKDTIFPKVRLSNSYDGRVKYNFTLGFFRLVCSNGLAIPEGDVIQIKKLHTPSLSELTSFEKVMEMTSEFIKNSGRLSEVFFELDEREIKDPIGRVEEIIEQTDFPASLQEDVMFRLNQETEMLHAKTTDWLVYNAFNYQLNHNDGVKTKELKRETIDNQILRYLRDY